MAADSTTETAVIGPLSPELARDVFVRALPNDLAFDAKIVREGAPDGSVAGILQAKRDGIPVEGCK